MEPLSARGDEAQGDFRLPRPARITTADEIRGLLKRGKRRRTRHLDVFVSPSPDVLPRIGIVVPKPRAKTSRSGGPVRGAAVQRNRLKRRLREIGRTTVLPKLRAAGTALDVLIRARPEAYGADFAELRSDLAALTEDLCSRAR